MQSILVVVGLLCIAGYIIYNKYVQFKDDSERVLSYIRSYPSGNGELVSSHIREVLGIPRGTINVMLGNLEDKGLIKSYKSEKPLQHSKQLPQRAYLPIVTK